MENLYKISNKENYLLIDLKGILSSKNIIDASKQIMEIPEFHFRQTAIWDVTAADLSNIDSNEIVHAAKEIDSIYREIELGKIALVSENMLNVGIIALFRELFEKKVVRVFEKFCEAEKWVKT